MALKVCSCRDPFDIATPHIFRTLQRVSMTFYVSLSRKQFNKGLTYSNVSLNVSLYTIGRGEHHF